MTTKDVSVRDTELPKEKLKYPRSIFFIIGNEFCERFTFYGLRTILVIYLTRRLYYSDESGTVIYHGFILLAYFTPVLGAIIADSWLGKFRTILYLSIIYACGSFILSGGAFPNDIGTMKILSLIGLFIIGVGTGGIKPCVSAFGGDQFQEGQEKELQKFFSFFYLAINLGSAISTYITPILREDVHCFGEKTCFPLAFGVPALLMVVALILFICGKSLYEIRPPEGNIVLQVSKCICYAIKNKCKSSEKKKSHWLDYADDKYDKKLIADIKILFHVLVLYIPLPLFWALFDQQGSRWTLQATRLDGVVGGFHIKADQMQVLNSFLIIAFIPLFNYVVYPLLDKCRLLRKPLQKMTVGGILAALSFVLAGLIELQLESHMPIPPNVGQSEMTVINNSPCNININGTDLERIEAFQTGVQKGIELNELSTWNFIPSGCNVTTPYNFTFNSTSPIESMMITIQDSKLVVLKSEDTIHKSSTGDSKIRFFYNIDPLNEGNISIILEKDDIRYYMEPEVQSIGITKYRDIPPGRYKLFISFNETQEVEMQMSDGQFKSGGVYIVRIYSKTAEKRKVTGVYAMVQGNFLSILYQVPQYVLVTAGEILFSITGLEFSYSQSAKSMKSVLQAAWLLTVAFGNLIVLIVAKAKLSDNVSFEFFLFAILMGVDMLIFAILAYFYKYVDIKIGNSEQTGTPTGRTNDAYVEETDFNK